MRSPRALTVATALLASLVLTSCGGDEEAQPVEAGAGGGGSQAPQGGQIGGRSGDPAEEDATGSSGQEEEEAQGSGGERAEESAEGDSPPAGSGSPDDGEAERDSSGGDRRGSSGRGQAVFGSEVEVKPVEPGSAQCEVDLGGSTATLPCERAEQFFGGG